jgi:RNA polymerase sigma-70 factor, ECF subfamily
MTDPARPREYRELAVADDLATVLRNEFAYVWNTLRRLGVHADDLADEAQEVFLTVHRIFADYDRGRPLRPWLFGIAYRVAARYRRARAKHPLAEPVELIDPSPTADEALEASEAQALVIEALQTIDLGRRAVFILSDIEERTAPEIAEALALPLNTVYSRLRVARAEFRDAVTRLQRRKGVDR